MKLSVIVPVYNVEYYLPACLNSILPVLENEDELFLIQGKSTDQADITSLSIFISSDSGVGSKWARVIKCPKLWLACSERGPDFIY